MVALQEMGSLLLPVNQFMGEFHFGATEAPIGTVLINRGINRYTGEAVTTIIRPASKTEPQYILTLEESVDRVLAHLQVGIDVALKVYEGASGQRCPVGYASEEDFLVDSEQFLPAVLKPVESLSNFETGTWYGLDTGVVPSFHLLQMKEDDGTITQYLFYPQVRDTDISYELFDEKRFSSEKAAAAKAKYVECRAIIINLGVNEKLS